MADAMRIEVDLYNELTIFSDAGALLYRGKPEGYPVQKAVAVEGLGTVVLLKYWEKKTGSFENLLLLDTSGAVLWRAQLPSSSSDAFVDFEFCDGKLIAHSWSCYRVEIEPK